MVKRIVAACLVFMVMVPSFVSCSTANEAAVSLVPDSATMVVRIQIAQILSNPALKKIYDEFPRTDSSWPQTADEALNQLLQKTGIDPYTISSLVIFADVESPEMKQNYYAGLIAVGSFDEATVLEKIEQETRQELIGSSYKGFKIYTGAQQESEIVFIDTNRIVLGTPEAVRGVIDVFNGDRNPLSGNIVSALNRIGTAQITGAFESSANVSNHIGDSILQEIQFSLRPLHDMEMLAFALDLQVLNLESRVDAYFSSPDSAQDARDAITGMISIAKAATQDQNIETTLNSIQVSTSDSRISVRGMTSLAQIAAMSGDMTPTK